MAIVLSVPWHFDVSILTLYLSDYTDFIFSWLIQRLSLFSLPFQGSAGHSGISLVIITIPLVDSIKCSTLAADNEPKVLYNQLWLFKLCKVPVLLSRSRAHKCLNIHPLCKESSVMGKNNEMQRFYITVILLLWWWFHSCCSFRSSFYLQFCPCMVLYIWWLTE